MTKKIKKHWKIIEKMNDEKLKEFISSFLIKRFGKDVIKDTKYFELWFNRFRIEKNYLIYMDVKSRAIFFSLLNLEVKR
jgi:hypothetical protein